MSEIDKKLGEVIDKLTKLAEAHGGQAVDLAVQVTRIDCFAALGAGALGTVVTAIGGYYVYRWWRYIHSNWEKLCRNDTEFPNGLFAGLTSVALFFVGAGSLFGGILNFWNWAGAFEPKLYLAKQIMTAAGLK